MKHQSVQPKWWQLYLTFPLMVVLFAIEGRLKLSTYARQIAQLGIILLVFGLVHLWLKANEAAMRQMDHVQRGYFITYTSAALPENKSTARFGDPAIKGVLSDTFEMDVIDAEFLPVQEEIEEQK